MTKIKDLVEKYGDREINEVELEKILKPVKVKTIYDIKHGTEYWYIDSTGHALHGKWINHSIDKAQLEIGNVFLTKEEAMFEIEYRKVKAELKRYASMCETEVDWSDEDQAKFSLYYSHNNEVLAIRLKWWENNSEIFFTNLSILEQAIEEIGEERIKKYYLGIKGENK